MITKPKFGIEQLAKMMNEPPKMVRRKLRKHGIKKTGRFYDFKSETGVDEAKAKLTA